MINVEGFTKRLQEIIEYYGESAAVFAEKIGVQRSSISHILSGRNKPSLEFVLKILSAYPEVELYWLLNGRGSFPALDKNKFQNNETSITITSENDKPEKDEQNLLTKNLSETNKGIERIVIFYKDGTFKNFQN